jgi:hypothetical protein
MSLKEHLFYTLFTATVSCAFGLFLVGVLY